MVDPTNGVQVPVVSMFYSIIGILLFFAMDGHLVAIQVVGDSFISMPIASSGIPIGFALMMFSLGNVETHFVRLTHEGLTLMRQLVNL